jgi:hypothetical protein
MANRQLTADIIASEAIAILDNSLVMGKNVYRAEGEFSKSVNGYRVGDTVNFRRPADFTVRTGATAAIQDVNEGKVALAVQNQAGVDFQFTSADLTMKIDDVSERAIKPAMVQLANYIDRQLTGLYASVPHWVGTPGQTINSYTDLAEAFRRLDDVAAPMDERKAILSPADFWAMTGAQTGLFINEAAKGAYREGSLGKIGGVDTFMSQNVVAHTCGSDMSGTINAAITENTLTYDDVKDMTPMRQTITTASIGFLAGDVFTIADVYEINPVTKLSTGVLKQFTVVSGSSNTYVISPAILWPNTSGAHANCFITTTVTDLNSAAVTGVGTANTAYRQNMVFHKNAFALACVPMEKPAGAVDVARKSYKGLSVRVIPYYDGTNDISNWRCDVLFGVVALDPRIACRVSGT